MPLIPDNNLSSLAQIKQKVRRLTRSPSLAQLSEVDLEQYINQFLLYDFPEHLRLWSQRTVFKFWTQPNIGRYQTNVTDPANPLYNFKNLEVTTEKPVYVAGYEVNVYQDRELFYANWPRIMQIQQIGTGDGITTQYNGVLNTNFPNAPLSATPILQDWVTFNSVTTDNAGLVLTDRPINGLTGDLIIPNNPQNNSIPPNPPAIAGAVNYLTGQFTLQFISPPIAGAKVNAQYVLYQPSRPLSILFFDDQIVLRPVPDQVYEVEMEVYTRPTFFLANDNTQVPKLAQWWAYISYGVSRAIFQDRLDTDSLQLIEPEFQKQQRLVLRQTLRQLSKQRSTTVFLGMNDGFGNAGFGWWTNQF